jgi:hypothetical protein
MAATSPTSLQDEAALTLWQRPSVLNNESTPVSLPEEVLRCGGYMGNQCAIVIERPPSTAVYTICAAMATEMLDVTEAKATTTLNRTTPDKTELLEPSIPSEGADDTMPRRMVAACGERPSGPSPA